MGDKQRAIIILQDKLFAPQVFSMKDRRTKVIYFFHQGVKINYFWYPMKVVR